MTAATGKFPTAHRKLRLAALVVLFALVCAACATTTGTPKQQMREWANGASYDSSNQTIEGDLVSIAAAIRAKDLIGLHTVCEGFGADVQTLYGELPTPNQTLTNELNVALENDFEESAIDCFEAPSFTAARYARFTAELARGKRAYAQARKRLASFGVR